MQLAKRAARRACRCTQRAHETRQTPEIPHGGRGDRGALEPQLKGAGVGVAGCRAIHCEVNDESAGVVSASSAAGVGVSGGSGSELVIARRGKCVSVLRLSAATFLQLKPAH